MNVNFPNPGFLEQVQTLTRQAGALLIFDEIITGFRYSKGGAQELFGITPDLSTFGKGMANGFPLSAVVGRREVMLAMEEIFFSGTFGGELLSLTAAKAVLEWHLREDLCGKLLSTGQNLSDKAEMAITQNGLAGVLKISGHPSWRFLNWTAAEDYSVDELRTYFMQEVFKRGLLVLSTHNVTLAHTPRVINKISGIYNEVFNKLNQALSNETLREELKATPLKPLFKVR